MADSSLQDRLRGHAKAFDGLLSLIPAKMYYGEDNSDQWQKKKQTKAEAAAARRLKLDPDSELNRNAKEVMDERAKNKRKLREMEQEGKDDDAWEDYEAVEGIEVEKPLEGLKKKTSEPNKKQKLDDAETDAKPITESSSSKQSRKEEKKAAKKAAKKEKLEKNEKKDLDEGKIPAAAPKSQKQTKKQAKNPAPPKSESVEEDVKQEKSELQAIDISGLVKDDAAPSSSESEPHSPTFDNTETTTASNEPLAEPASTTTSVSSTIPPSEKPKHIKIPADTEALRARLAAKIEALRAARKADGPDGKPIRTRQELIESRRKKAAQRKEHKQELRKQAKLEEQRKREEALASNSPSVMSPAVELDDAASNFAFGRVAFGDGTKLSHDLSYVLNQGKKKGPSDPKTALLKVQNQKKRLEELGEDKKKDIEEKDTWLNARRRVEGEKIKDDENLLKKAVKRKEVQKRKSELAWKDRSEGVKMAQKQRQKKREDNLRQRREEKGKGGKKKKKGGAPKKKGGRPGFEGSLGMGGKRK
ncbi:Fc.00g013660.m01.CDS01 [Cosmosporella sp. VM-42]